MKKINVFNSGFTITELLVSMLIVMFVAAAMVPVIGPKMIKKNIFTKAEHGIMMCYADGETIHSYYADTRGNDSPVRIEGGACRFTPPSANKYEMIIIGAGTRGVDDTENIPAYRFVNVAPFRGYFRLDNWDTGDWTNLRDGRQGFTPVTNYPDDVTFPLISIDDKKDPRDQMLTALKNLFNNWDGQLRDQFNNTGLYVEFSDIRNPVQKGGGSRTWIQQMTYNPDGSGDRCNQTCQFNFNNPQGRLEMEPICANRFVRRNDDSEAMAIFHRDEISTASALAEDHNKRVFSPVECWAPIFTRGGNSGPVVQSDNLSFLFPLTAWGSRIGIDTGNSGRWNEDNNRYITRGAEDFRSNLNLSTDNNGIINQFTMQQSQHGNNGTQSGNGANNNNAALSSFNIVNNGILHGGAAYEPSGAFRLGGDRIPQGFSQGDVNAGTTTVSIEEVTEAQGCPPGRYCVRNNYVHYDNNVEEHGNIRYQGSVAGEAPAFTWEYPGTPQYDFFIGPSGNPGEVKSITLPRLTRGEEDVLFLYPNTRAPSDAFSGVSYRNGKENSIYRAHRGESVNAPIHITEEADNDTPHLPRRETIDRTQPHNDKISPIIDRINAYGRYQLRGRGLNPFLNCQAANSCPGYGGFGVYPLLYANRNGGELTITNNQAYARDNEQFRAITIRDPNDVERNGTVGVRSISIDYGIVNGDASELRCHDGSEPVEDNRHMIEGTDRNMFYCGRQNNNNTGGGAIIILW